MTLQEIVRPDVFWYDAALKSNIPPKTLMGLLAFELFAMHWVEVCCPQKFLHLFIHVDIVGAQVPCGTWPHLPHNWHLQDLAFTMVALHSQ